jgi:hypothetical protein
VVILTLLTSVALSSSPVDLAQRRQRGGEVYTCSVEPAVERVRAEAELSGGTVRWASSFVSVQDAFGSPSLSVGRPLAESPSHAAGQHVSIGYFERRYRRGQQLQLVIRSATGEVMVRGPLMRSRRNGYISYPLNDAWLAALRFQPSHFVIAVLDRSGVEIERSTISVATLNARLAARDDAETRLRAMIADYQNLCDREGDEIIVT